MRNWFDDYQTPESRFAKYWAAEEMAKQIIRNPEVMNDFESWEKEKHKKDYVEYFTGTYFESDNNLSQILKKEWFR